MNSRKIKALEQAIRRNHNCTLRDYVIREYEKGKYLYEISASLEVHRQTLSRFMDEEAIEKRSRSEITILSDRRTGRSRDPGGRVLEKYHLDEEMSTDKIASKYERHVNTVYRWFKKHGIVARGYLWRKLNPRDENGRFVEKK